MPPNYKVYCFDYCSLFRKATVRLNTKSLLRFSTLSRTLSSLVPWTNTAYLAVYPDTSPQYIPAAKSLPVYRRGRPDCRRHGDPGSKHGYKSSWLSRLCDRAVLGRFECPSHPQASKSRTAKSKTPSRAMLRPRRRLNVWYAINCAKGGLAAIAIPVPSYISYGGPKYPQLGKGCQELGASGPPTVPSR